MLHFHFKTFQHPDYTLQEVYQQSATGQSEYLLAPVNREVQTKVLSLKTSTLRGAPVADHASHTDDDHVFIGRVAHFKYKYLPAVYG